MARRPRPARGRGGAPRPWALAALHGPLESRNAAELLAPDFPTRLAALLADPPPPPALAEARALHPLLGARAGRPAALDLTPVLALFAVAVFALERWLATRRRAQTP